MKTKIIITTILVFVVLTVSALAILGAKDTPENKEQQYVTMTFKPMQCQDEPWNVWLANSSIRYIKAPTESEVITTYYGQAHNVTVSDYKRINLGQATCQACDVCVKGYVIEVTVPKEASGILEADGWTQN